MGAFSYISLMLVGAHPHCVVGTVDFIKKKVVFYITK